MVEPKLKDAKSIRQFIKQSGYIISSDEDSEGNINPVRSETVIGKYYGENTSIDLYLEHSHDSRQPEGGHAAQLNEVLGLRLILYQADIPYNEMPSGEDVANTIDAKVRELTNLSGKIRSLPSKK